VSACLIREEIAAAWGSSTGEAIHTSTFLGNPLGCAAALASLDVLLDPETALAIRTRAERFEESLNEALRDHRLGVPRRTFARLLIGLALEGGAPRALAVMRALLERGFIVLPGGVRGDVLTLTPPCAITDAQIDAFAEALGDVLRAFPVP
jgi:4-aminobutyrate aminotransferase/(S)-3-amino-2-methylpropionate transaminase